MAAAQSILYPVQTLGLPACLERHSPTRGSSPTLRHRCAPGLKAILKYPCGVLVELQIRHHKLPNYISDVHGQWFVDIRDVVGELVVADLQLYQHATRIFENRLQSRSAPVPKRRRGSPSRRMAFKASRET